MSIKKVDAKALDKILETMVSTVSESKDEVFDIGEQCRKDFESLTKELDDVKIRVAIVITDSDALDSKARFARKRLSEVSMHFNHFSEKQVRDAYERAHSRKSIYK